MKLHVHNHTLVIYIQYKFQKYHLLVTKLWLRTEKSLKFRHWKGNNSSITDDTLVKLRVHNQTVIIYSKYKFYEIPSIGYLVMAEDGRTDELKGGQTETLDRTTDGQRQTYITPPSVGITRKHNWSSKHNDF